MNQLRAAGVGLDISQTGLIERYLEHIVLFGSKTNLVGSLDREFLEEQAVLGSLVPTRYYPFSGQVIDVGTGAGIPGIPLAILYPEVTFTLVENRRKRVAFLEHVVRDLSLNNVVIKGCSVEHVVDNVGENKYDCAVSRAFRPPKQWVQVAYSLLVEGGHVLVFTSETDWKNAAYSGFEPVDKIEDKSGDNRILVCLRKAEIVI
jgi:16S rRNA (guanine527-N7)-methyltransferase